MPKLAILFWFYKELDLCIERINLLRRLNPSVLIYGLFGGSRNDEPRVLAEIRPLLDDLHVFDEQRDPHWKWLNGDLMIAHWMRERGRALSWDTVVLVQWDMLMLEPVDVLFHDLELGEALFSGHRPMDEVSEWWGWAGRRDPEKAAMLARFEETLRRNWGYQGQLWCCLFIVVCLPRSFLSRYAAEAPDVGFLEYKTPTLCHAWGTPVREAPRFQPWWAADPATRDAPPAVRALNAVGQAVSPAFVSEQLADPGGLRVFHPFDQTFPDAVPFTRPAERRPDRA